MATSKTAESKTAIRSMLEEWGYQPAKTWKGGLLKAEHPDTRWQLDVGRNARFERKDNGKWVKVRSYPMSGLAEYLKGGGAFDPFDPPEESLVAGKAPPKKASKRSSVKKTSRKVSKLSSARKSPSKVSKRSPRKPARQGPFTSGDVARFNNLTWYPRPVQQWNASYWEDIDRISDWAADRLTAWGVEGVPQEVEAAIQRYGRALYRQGMESIRSREVAPPWTVTGRSGYKGKPDKARTIDKNAHDAVEKAHAKAIKAVRKYSPRAAVRSDDPEAVVKIQKKIDGLEGLQVTMKAANKIVRKKGPSNTQKIEQLAQLEGISEKTAGALLEPDFSGRLGFAGYQIQNNNANIRRLKERLDLLRKQAKMVDQQFEFDGGTLEINTADTRVQIFFDSKPEDHIRKNLSRHGFKWARSVGAWQRLLNEQAIRAAKEVLAEHGMAVQEPTTEGAVPDDNAPTAHSSLEQIALSAKAQEESAAQPDPSGAARLIITDADAFEKLTQIEGKHWATREQEHAADPDTFFDAQAGFQILIDDGLVGKTTQDPDTGEQRKVLIGDITGSSGFVGAGEEIYIVLADGQVALFGDTASGAKVERARKILKVLGDPTPRKSSRKSSPPKAGTPATIARHAWMVTGIAIAGAIVEKTSGNVREPGVQESAKAAKVVAQAEGLTADALVKKLRADPNYVRSFLQEAVGPMQQATGKHRTEWLDFQQQRVQANTPKAPAWLTDLQVGQKIKITSRELNSLTRVVEVSTRPTISPEGMAGAGMVRVYVTSGKTRTVPSGGALEWWNAEEGVTYQPTMSQPKVHVDKVELIEDATGEKRLAEFRNIRDTHSIGEVEGTEVDATTAAMVLSAYDALNEANRLKFMSKSVPEIINITFKLHR